MRGATLCVAASLLICTAAQTSKTSQPGPKRVHMDPSRVDNTPCAASGLQSDEFCYRYSQYTLTQAAADFQQDLDNAARVNWERNMRSRFAFSGSNISHLPPTNCTEAYHKFSCYKEFFECVSFRSTSWYFWSDKSYKFPMCHDDCMNVRQHCKDDNYTGATAIPLEKTCRDLPDDCCMGKIHYSCYDNHFPWPWILIFILLGVCVIYSCVHCGGKEAMASYMDTSNAEETEALKSAESSDA